MFKKYQHIEKLGHSRTRGLLDGDVYVFPKLDGTNGSIWLGENGIETGKRTQLCSIYNDNAGFARYVQDNKEKYESFFNEFPDARLYGEWLVPHSIKYYKKDAWRRFYVFDVMRGDTYIRYEDYAKILSDYEIDYVPLICRMSNPSTGELLDTFPMTTFLIEEEGKVGEGIVVKRYEFKNEHGETVWGKLVNYAAFTQTAHVPRMPPNAGIEWKIAQRLFNEAFFNKEKAKMYGDREIDGNMIFPLMKRCYYVFLGEEITHIIEKYKGVTINFELLQKECFALMREFLKIG